MPASASCFCFLTALRKGAYSRGAAGAAVGVRTHPHAPLATAAVPKSAEAPGGAEEPLVLLQTPPRLRVQQLSVLAGFEPIRLNKTRRPRPLGSRPARTPASGAQMGDGGRWCVVRALGAARQGGGAERSYRNPYPLSPTDI